jgi:hypothetical protein
MKRKAAAAARTQGASRSIDRDGFLFGGIFYFPKCWLNE